MKRAIVLLSGGLDSTVILALALAQGRECYALSFDYGQRHRIELTHASKIATYYQVKHCIVQIDSRVFKSSSLVSDLAVPKNRSKEDIGSGKTPNTYVPARNTLFLAYAMGQAEILDAQEIYLGANALDAPSYPDCTLSYIQAFQQVLNVGTKQAAEGNAPQLLTPLIHWDKAEIIRQGIALDVPMHMTFSCYDPTPQQKPCGQCDACILRAHGFVAAKG
ncbi:7-cyano-7-deazaguanine synthase QueC [Neochlamydia sp. S13]|uniref:7-cyano-7-deazaguanine synthase QueC n=1 Tax=Neochlamydia sp. S13 TaxID=1353976 RepID=UPI0005A77650|nr:7-cyano-7-deazaguanine synthase QueC [Neochlamydia sp. S13]BBI16679.1 7-cyano-7-deazaguanine synthase [Neochlamydia sp. S13]